MNRLYFLVACLFLAGCAFQVSLEPRMTIDGPSQLVMCGSTGGDPQSDADITATRIQLLNASSGEIVQGSGTITFSGRSMSGVGNDSYTCEQLSGSTDVYIAVHASGFSPTGFGYTLPPSKRVTFTIPLQESCTGAPGCFDIARLQGADAETNAREFVTNSLHQTFNLTEYDLSCIECSVTRGGFVRAQGTLANGTAFAAYVRHGWCSSGGADCGATTCYAEAIDVAALGATCLNPPIVTRSGR